MKLDFALKSPHTRISVRPGERNRRRWSVTDCLGRLILERLTFLFFQCSSSSEHQKEQIIEMYQPGCESTPPAQNANRAVMRRNTPCYYKHGRRSERTVALTFDDGPNPPRTEQILAILRDAGVKATFFVMGKWAERFPDTVRRMVAEGHLVGNHGYGGERQLGDADEAEAVIGHITGQPCHYLRAHCFNYAAFFNAEVTCLATSYVVDANVSGDDWKFEYNGWPITTTEEVVRNVLESPNLGPGSIILLQDGSESSEAYRRLLCPLPTIAALPCIIDGLRERGLKPVRVDQMHLDEPLEWMGN